MNEKIISDLVGTGIWSESSAKKGLRADFKCEYCGKDLIASVDNYKEWHEDHIIPKYYGGTDDEFNIAISCKTCNFIKSKFNPNELLPSELKTDRDMQIKISREYI